MTTTAMTGTLSDGAGSLSGGSHTAFVPEWWAAGALKASEFAATLQTRVTTEYQGTVQKGGDTVNIPRQSNLTANSKSAGYTNSITFEAITEGTQQLTIAYHQYAAFLIEDALQAQAYQELRGPYEKKIGYALARAIDVTLAALVASLTNSKGTLGNELTQDDYLDAQLVLAQAGLLESSPDPGADFSVFLTPAAYNAALKTEVFINKDYNGAANAIQAAQVGNIYGFTVFRSNLLTSNGAGHDCVMMHRGCFALAKQKSLTIKNQYLIERSGDAVMGYNIYGVAELNYPPETAGGGAAVDNRGVWLKTL